MMRKNELYNGIGTGFFNIENGPFIIFPAISLHL